MAARSLQTGSVKSGMKEHERKMLGGVKLK
jgi:hypothetical protein